MNKNLPVAFVPAKAVREAAFLDKLDQLATLNGRNAELATWLLQSGFDPPEDVLAFNTGICAGPENPEMLEQARAFYATNMLYDLVEAVWEKRDKHSVQYTEDEFLGYVTIDGKEYLAGMGAGAGYLRLLVAAGILPKEGNEKT